MWFSCIGDDGLGFVALTCSGFMHILYILDALGGVDSWHLHGMDIEIKSTRNFGSSIKDLHLD